MSSTPLANQPGIQDDGDDIRIYDQDKSRKRKEFWNDYKTYRDNDNRKRAECIHCHKTFAADPITNGTGNLSRHWKACVGNPRNKSKGTQSKLKLKKVEEPVDRKTSEWVLDEGKAREAFFRMVAMGDVPLEMVEHDTLREFVSSLCPTFPMPSLASVEHGCYELFLKEKVKLEEFLKKSCQRVSLITDSWTSVQGKHFMSLVARFIDNDWKLQKRILNFCETNTDEEDSLAREIKDYLRSWGLSKKVFTITVDNSSANDVACAHLRQMVIENGTFINHGKNLQVSCVAQIITSIVWDVLEEYYVLVDKVRDNIMFVKDDLDRLFAFKEQAEKLGVDWKSSLRLDITSLCIDVPIRWDSTYRMLAGALKDKDVFAKLDIPMEADGLFVGGITSEEWMKIEKLVGFLKPFIDLANHVSSSSVTLNTVFFHIVHTVRLLDEWVQNSGPGCRSMTLLMKMKCDKRWGDLKKMNMLIYVAIILDPAYKYLGLQYAFHRFYGREAGDSLAARVKEFAQELFSEYRNIYAPTSQSESSKSNISSELMDNGEVPSFIKEVRMELDGQDPIAPLQTDFDRYLLEENAFGEEDILTWWRLNGPRFPILAHMARDVLAIPVSTLSSEYAFTTERTLTESRSSLTPEILQALTCTQDWLGKGSQEYESDEGVSSEEIEQLEKDLQDGVFLVSD